MSLNKQRVEMIQERLASELSPISLEIIDDSHKHAGHASAGGAGHFTVNIVADAFKDKSLLQRHRLVYDAVQELMQVHIHALSISAKSPDESH